MDIFRWTVYRVFMGSNVLADYFPNRPFSKGTVQFPLHSCVKSSLCSGSSVSWVERFPMKIYSLDTPRLPVFRRQESAEGAILPGVPWFAYLSSIANDELKTNFILLSLLLEVVRYVSVIVSHLMNRIYRIVTYCVERMWRKVDRYTI